MLHWITLELALPVSDLMTRELEMSPIDEGEKLTCTGSSFCWYKTTTQNICSILAENQKYTLNINSKNNNVIDRP